MVGDPSGVDAELRRELAHRDRVLRSVLDLYRRALTSPGNDVADEALRAAIAAAPGATHGSLLLRTARGTFAFAAVHGYDPAALVGIELPGDRVLFGHDWHGGASFLVRDIEAANANLERDYPHLGPLVELTRSAQAREALVAPVVHNGELVAAISVEHMGPAEAFSVAHGELLSLVAQSVGALLQRHEAEARATLMTQAVDAATDGIAIVEVLDGGAHAQIRHANRAFARTLGFAPGEAPQWRLAGKVTPEDAVRVRDAAAKAAFEGVSDRFDLRVLAPELSASWVEIAVERVSTDGGNPRLLVSLRDVSERYRFTEQLQRLNAELSARLDEARALEAIDSAITRTIDEVTMLSGVLAEVSRRPGVAAAALFVRDATPGDLRLAAADAAARALGLAARPLAPSDAVHVVRAQRAPLALSGDDPRHPLHTISATRPLAPYRAWPLEAQGAVVGVLEVVLEARFEPDAAWRSFMRAIATQVAVAVEHAAMVGRLRRSAHAYATLASFNEAIEHADDPDELIDLGVQTLLREFGMQRAGYFVLRDDGHLHPERRWGELDPAAQEVVNRPNPLGVGAIGTAASSGEAVYVADYASWSGAMPAATAVGLRSLLALPVRSGGSVQAVIGLGSYQRSVLLRSDQVTIARAFARRLEHALERLVSERQIVRTREEAFRALGVALEYRDYETKGHTDRVVALARRLGERVGLTSDDLEALAWGAYLHDLGKIAIPDHILLKPAELTPAEFEQVKRHTQVGYDMSRDLTFLPHDTRLVMRSHHERWDGSGYPDGLAGEAIPYLARLFALVDVYDALTSARPYKRAWSHAEAVAELAAQAGAQFDPILTQAMLALLEEPDPAG